MSLDRWGQLADMFEPSQGNPHVVDNRTVAGPALMAAVPSAPSHGLDYGAGTAWLAAELQLQGHDMTAFEPSPGMLGKARAVFGERLRLVGDLNELTGEDFDFITAMMVLQFVEHLDQFGEAMADLSHVGSRLVAATHTPEYLSFAEQHPGMPIKDGTLNLGSGPIPIFSRSFQDYEAPLSRSGWQLRTTQRVAFPNAFHERFPGAEPQDAPAKFLVMSLRRE